MKRKSGKRMVFVFFCVILCFLTACGDIDAIVTTTTASVTTSVTTTRGVVSFTPPDVPLQVPEPIQREAWNVTMEILEQTDTAIKIRLQDEDELGFWYVADLLRFERQKEDGSWELLASDTHEIGKPYPAIAIVRQTTSCTFLMPLREAWGIPLASGNYRFAKNVFNDKERTDGCTVALEFTIS